MKQFITFFLVLISITNINAQQNSTFGIVGGLNLSSLHDQESTNAQIRPGYRIGAFWHQNYQKVILKVEFAYSTEGTNYSPTINQNNPFIDLRRLSLPILLSIPFLNKFGFEVGPELKYQVGFKTNAISMKNNGDLESIYEPLDYGITAGVSYKLEKINVGFRNYFGLKYHHELDPSLAQNTYKTDRTNILQLLVSYRLN